MSSFEKLFLSTGDIVKMGLAKSHSTLKNWRDRGEGPVYVRMPNGRYVYPLGEFLQWLIERYIPKTTGLNSDTLERILELAHDA
jgi:hypothetical protein